MPLPDAKPDRRIYELLKTTDLENLTFSDFQKVAQTIYAEQGAEDELRRIVLVNLARLSVAGEWTGLTSAGGSGGVVMAESTYYGADTRYQLHKNGPFFASGAYSTYNFASLGNRATFYPFLAPATGTISEIGLSITSASVGYALKVGIYSTSAGGTPDSLLGSCDISTNSSGIVYQTSFTDTISVEKGTMYYVGYVRNNTNMAGSYTGPNDDGVTFCYTISNALSTDAQQGLAIGASSATSNFDLDATYSADNLFPVSAQGRAPCFSVKIT